jgi:hypothetical protein
VSISIDLTDTAHSPAIRLPQLMAALQLVKKRSNLHFTTPPLLSSIHKQLIHSTAHSNCGEVDSCLGKKPEKTVTYSN